MRIVTGHQPVYLPWLGLLHKAALADVFVYMDDVQYLEGDWNNRNRIKGPHGAFWLTVPVQRSGGSTPMLRDVRLVPDGWGTRRHWQAQHWLSLRSAYAKSPWWEDHAPFLEGVYLAARWDWLVELNAAVMQYLFRAFGIEAEWIVASECGFTGRKSDLVLEHALHFNAEICILGAHGREYLEIGEFMNHGVHVHFQDYQHPTYTQRFGEFASHLSAVDLLFNCGPDARRIMMQGNVDRHALEDEALRSVRTTSAVGAQR